MHYLLMSFAHTKKTEINARYRLSDRCGKGHTCRAVYERDEWSSLSLHAYIVSQLTCTYS